MNCPTLYITLGGLCLQRIIKEATKTHQNGEFFALSLAQHNHIQALGEIKAKIQKLHTHLSLTAINIYIATSAINYKENTLAICQSIQQIFMEDFNQVSINLVALLTETSEKMSHMSLKKRRNRTHRFLISLTGEHPFNHIFLLSDCNQKGQISPRNIKNAYKVLACLPFLQSSDFAQSMASKALYGKRVLFCTAGVGYAPTPPTNIHTKNHWEAFANHLNHSLIEFIHPDITPVKIDTQPIAQAIAAAPAADILPHKLWGKTMAQGESALFGDTLPHFIASNFSYTSPQVMLQGSIDKLVVEKTRLQLHIAQLTTAIAKIKKNVENPSKIKPFARISDIKLAIGKYHGLQFALGNLKNALDIYTQGYTQLHEFLQYLGHIASTLNQLPQVATPSWEAQLAQAQESPWLNISLLRDDGLVREKIVVDAQGSPYVLHVAGGFYLEDLTRYQAMRGAP